MLNTNSNEHCCYCLFFYIFYKSFQYIIVDPNPYEFATDQIQMWARRTLSFKYHVSVENRVVLFFAYLVFLECLIGDVLFRPILKNPCNRVFIVLSGEIKKITKDVKSFEHVNGIEQIMA